MNLRKRTTRCICLTRALKVLNTLMEREQSNMIEMKSAFEGLLRRYQEQEEVSTKVLKDMYSAEDIEDKDLKKTCEENLKYESQFLTAKSLFQERMAPKKEKS